LTSSPQKEAYTLAAAAEDAITAAAEAAAAVEAEGEDCDFF